jgi:hypothetical protein
MKDICLSMSKVKDNCDILMKHYIYKFVSVLDGVLWLWSVCLSNVKVIVSVTNDGVFTLPSPEWVFKQKYIFPTGR